MYRLAPVLSVGYCCPMAVQTCPELKEQVKALFITGLPPTRIAEIKPVRPELIQKWATRGKWVAIRDGNKAIIGKAVESVVSDSLSKASEAARSDLASELSQTTQTLKKTRPKSNLEHLGSRAKTLQSLTETASKLFGWGNQTLSSFGLVLLESPSSVLAEPAMDVQASVVQTTQGQPVQAQVPTTPSDAISTPVEPSTVQS